MLSLTQGIPETNNSHSQQQQYIHPNCSHVWFGAHFGKNIPEFVHVFIHFKLTDFNPSPCHKYYISI